jgi:NADPH-dependent ferric siderophore reductase
MVRVTLAGPELEGLVVAEPAASVRLLLPSPGEAQVAALAWNGNEFLLLDGRRPTIRTFTPVRLDVATLELDLDVVTHGGGAASAWAEDARNGAPAAVSGPGRGYTVDVDAPCYLVVGDETAIPAIRQLIAAIPPQIPVRVLIEVSEPGARVALPPHPGTTVDWFALPSGATVGDAMVSAIRDEELVPDVRVWVAGEAAAVQRIRRHLFEDRALPRAQATVRGYWKFGRASAEEV